GIDAKYANSGTVVCITPVTRERTANSSAGNLHLMNAIHYDSAGDIRVLNADILIHRKTALILRRQRKFECLVRVRGAHATVQPAAFDTNIPAGHEVRRAWIGDVPELDSIARISQRGTANKRQPVDPAPKAVTFNIDTSAVQCAASFPRTLRALAAAALDV